MRSFVVALLFATACGGGPGQGSGPLAPPGPPTAALAAWKNFPAGGNPRPVIAFDRSVDHIGPAGFSSEPDRKIAWFCNKFVLASGIHLTQDAPGPATAGPSGSYRSIGSARAFRELLASRQPAPTSAGCDKYQPFVIASVRWGTAAFPTDRGNMEMSAWLFDIAEIEAYLSYSAVDPTSFWGGGVNPDGGGSFRIAQDGRTLRIPVANAGPGPCGADYTASVAESDSAVAVAVKRYGHESSGQPVACTADLRISYISVTLQAPLGGRVLVDSSGKVATVCPETGTASQPVGGTARC